MTTSLPTWCMSYNQIQKSFTSCLLWTRHYTLGIFVYIISLNYHDSPVRYECSYLTEGETEAAAAAKSLSCV